MTVKLIRNTQLGLSLNKHIAVGDIGVPRYWVTVWEALNGHNYRPSTLAKRLSAIDQFYIFTTELSGSDCLDSIIASGNFDVLEQYLEAFFIHIRNTSSQTNQNHANRWLFVLDFTRDLMFRLSGTSTDEGTLLDLRRKIRRLDQLYASFRPKRQAKQQKIRALPASVIEELYQLTEPTSEKLSSLLSLFIGLMCMRIEKIDDRFMVSGLPIPYSTTLQHRPAPLTSPSKLQTLDSRIRFTSYKVYAIFDCGASGFRTARKVDVSMEMGECG